jgi:hypothetical protein
MGLQNPARKVTLKWIMSDPFVYVNTKKAMYGCFRLPGTVVIPAQAGTHQAPDERRRHGNKVLVTRICVRVSLANADTTRLMLFPYEPPEQVVGKLAKVPLKLTPDPVLGEVPEIFDTVRVAYPSMGIVSEHGPLMTRKKAEGLELDDTDGTPYTSRIANHKGKPVGAVYRKKFGGKLMRTSNWGDSQILTDGVGYTAWDVHEEERTWELNRKYEYQYEVGTTKRFDRDLEIFGYVDCPSDKDRTHEKEDTAILGAVLKSVVIDVYFRDVS